MKIALRALAGAGIAIVAIYAVGFVLAAVFGLVGGLATALFWAAVLAGLAFLASAIWRSVTGSR